MKKDERTQKAIFGRCDHWVKLVNNIWISLYYVLQPHMNLQWPQNKMVNLKINHEFKGSIALFLL